MTYIETKGKNPRNKTIKANPQVTKMTESAKDSKIIIIIAFHLRYRSYKMDPN